MRDLTRSQITERIGQLNRSIERLETWIEYQYDLIRNLRGIDRQTRLAFETSMLAQKTYHMYGLRIVRVKLVEMLEGAPRP